jgi:hypothetical protein
MTAATDEMRRRLDVPVDLVPDALLDQFLANAAQLIAPWVATTTPAARTTTDPYADVYTDLYAVVDPMYWGLVDEATVQLALKIWDVSTRGAVGMDAVGEFLAPAPSATPGLVRSVFGVLGPAMTTGGISV